MKTIISFVVLVFMTIPVFASGGYMPNPSPLAVFDDRVRNVIGVDDHGAFFAASFGLELFNMQDPLAIPDGQEARLYRFNIENSALSWRIENFTTIVMNQSQLNLSSPINSYTSADLTNMVSSFGLIEANQRYQGASGFWSSPVLYREDYPISLTHDRVILLNKSGTLLSIKSDFTEGNATCDWTLNLRELERPIFSSHYKHEYMATPTLIGDRLYVVGLRTLFIVNATDGTIISLVRFNNLGMDDYFMTPVVFDTKDNLRRFYLISKEGSMFEVDTELTIDQISSEPDYSNSYTAPLVDSSGHIFYTGSSEELHLPKFHYSSQHMRSHLNQDNVVQTSINPDYGFKGTILSDRHNGIYFVKNDIINYYERDYNFDNFAGNTVYDPLIFSNSLSHPLEEGFRYINNHPALLERADLNRSVIVSINNYSPQPVCYPTTAVQADISESLISISYLAHNYMNASSTFTTFYQTSTTRMSWGGVTPYFSTCLGLNILYPDEEGYLTSYWDFMPVVGGVGPEAELGKELESIYPPLGHSKFMKGKDNVINLEIIPTFEVNVIPGEYPVVAIYVNGYGRIAQPQNVMYGNSGPFLMEQATFLDLISHPKYTINVIRQDNLGNYIISTFENIDISLGNVFLGSDQPLVVQANTTETIGEDYPISYSSITVGPGATLTIEQGSIVYVTGELVLLSGAQVILRDSSQLIVNRASCRSYQTYAQFIIDGSSSGKLIVRNNIDVDESAKLRFRGDNSATPSFNLSALIVKQGSEIEFFSNQTLNGESAPSARIGSLESSGLIKINACIIIDGRLNDHPGNSIIIGSSPYWGHLIWKVRYHSNFPDYSTVKTPFSLGYQGIEDVSKAKLTIDDGGLTFKINTCNVYGTMNIIGSASCFVNDSGTLKFHPGSVLNLNGGDGIENGAQLVANGNEVLHFGTIQLSPNVHISGYKKNPNPNTAGSYGDRIYISDMGRLCGGNNDNPRILEQLLVSSSHPQNHRWDGIINDSSWTGDLNFMLHDSTIEGIDRIYVKNPASPEYHQNYFENCTYGIYHLIEDGSAPQISIVENTFRSNSFGIYLEDNGPGNIPDTFTVLIDECDFGSSQDSAMGNSTAIALRRSSEAKIKSSSFYNNGYGIVAIKSVLVVGGVYTAPLGIPAEDYTSLFVDNKYAAILMEHTTWGEHKSLIYGNTFTSSNPSTVGHGIGIWVSNSEVDIVSNNFFNLAGHGVLLKGYSWKPNPNYHGFSYNNFQNNNGCEMIGDTASICASATRDNMTPENLFADQAYQETGIWPQDPLSEMAAWDKYILANLSTGGLSGRADVRGNYFAASPLTLRNRFYTSYRDFIFDPDAISPLTELLDQGISKFYQGLFDQSILTMKQVVETYPDSSQTALALDFLYLATRASDADYSALKTYLEYTVPDEEMILYQKSEEIKTACAIQERDYYTAISRLQSVLNDPKTVADSLFALIDQAYCFMALAQSGAKALPIISVYTPDFASYINFLHNLKSSYASSSNGANVPMVLKLESNYPNPFNPSTTIRFGIPTDGTVKLSIYNLKGQRVKELLNEKVLAGNHSIVWNGTDANNSKVGSGIYFSRLEFAGKSKLKKMMLVK